MPTLKESTEKLVAATDRLLQDYKMERSARKVEEEKAHAQIKDLKEQLTALQNKYESAVNKHEVEMSARKISSPNPTIQSHDTAAFFSRSNRCACGGNRRMFVLSKFTE